MTVSEITLPASPLEVLERLVDAPRCAYLEGLRDATGRTYTVLGWNPRATFEVPATPLALEPDPLAALDAFVGALPRSGDAVGFPFRSAAIGYMTYDLRTVIERVPARARDDLKLPRAQFTWFDPLLVHDDTAQRYYLVSSQEPDAVAAAHRDLLARVEREARPPAGQPDAPARLESNLSLDEYRRAIGRVRELIAAGDVYQINFTQRFSAEIRAEPLALFGQLVRRHPMPRSAYLDTGTFQILSNSPELFLERHGSRIATQPIKGTRPRGLNETEDRVRRAELLADPKERAEHVMIVDLERNDLGRICRTGSVHVQDAAHVQTYPTLHHLVSTVEGTLEEGISIADIIRATFPGGSVTGAPKIRAMEIIDALEPHARGVYTGALGLIDARGDMHLSLPIRTAVTVAGRVYYGAGGGIVIDSDADAEYAESLLKARALLTALGATFAEGT